MQKCHKTLLSHKHNRFTKQQFQNWKKQFTKLEVEQIGSRNGVALNICQFTCLSNAAEGNAGQKSHKTMRKEQTGHPEQVCSNVCHLTISLGGRGRKQGLRWFYLISPCKDGNNRLFTCSLSLQYKKEVNSILQPFLLYSHQKGVHPVLADIVF